MTDRRVRGHPVLPTLFGVHSPARTSDPHLPRGIWSLCPGQRASLVEGQTQGVGSLQPAVRGPPERRPLRLHQARG